MQRHANQQDEGGIGQRRCSPAPLRLQQPGQRPDDGGREAAGEDEYAKRRTRLVACDFSHRDLCRRRQHAGASKADNDPRQEIWHRTIGRGHDDETGSAQGRCQDHDWARAAALENDTQRPGGRGHDDEHNGRSRHDRRQDHIQVARHGRSRDGGQPERRAPADELRHRQGSDGSDCD